MDMQGALCRSRLMDSCHDPQAYVMTSAVGRACAIHGGYGGTSCDADDDGIGMRVGWAIKSDYLHWREGQWDQD